MEYTKDIILDVRYKKEIGLKKINYWTSNLRRKIKDNKFIIITLTLLSILIVVDIVLVNSFFELLSNIH